jgi:hypothetical protein
MRTSIVAGSLLAALSLAAPLSAQRVSADVAIRSGPVAGRVVVGDGYSTYRRPVVYRRVPARVIVVERVYVRHHRVLRNWKRHGFRQVVVFYQDGRYYDRDLRGGPPMRQLEIYERNGRYYHVCNEREWNDHYQGPHRYDDDRGRDHDRDWDD